MCQVWNKYGEVARADAEPVIDVPNLCGVLSPCKYKSRYIMLVVIICEYDYIMYPQRCINETEGMIVTGLYIYISLDKAVSALMLLAKAHMILFTM